MLQSKAKKPKDVTKSLIARGPFVQDPAILERMWGEGRWGNLEQEVRGFLHPTCLHPLNGSFRKLGVPSFGGLIIRILLFRILY